MKFQSRVAILPLALAVAAAAACSNNPYPDADSNKRVFYTAFLEAHRSLDPAVAYNVSAHKVTGLVFDTLLEYHYLKRPYELIPGTAKAVPVAEPLPDGGVRYSFALRRGVGYAPDPCFELGGKGRTTRDAVAADYAFQLMRLADPALNVRVRETFMRIRGFRAFHEALVARREAEPQFGELPPHEQYAQLGGISGVSTPDPYTLTVELDRPYPQILYWFALEFTTPQPWEAAAYYNSKEGRPRLADNPVGNGPYQIVEYNKYLRLVLERNPHWYGFAHPNAPGARYPAEGAAGDAEAGRLDLAGQKVATLERIEFRLDKESIPRFNKFLQGYYDNSAIIKESFDQVVQADRLTPEMEALGIRLETSVKPSVFYIGFNMRDPVVGYPAGESGKKLRQAMSLAADSKPYIEHFLNGRGIPAHSPLPPAIFGYRKEYKNPYREVNLERAKQLLAEAGYPDGIDPATGKPLRLSFDTYALDSQQELDRKFWINQWRRIGIETELSVTTYNEYQAKVQRLAYQVFFWGWSADYPDPENFLFLLSCKRTRADFGGSNTTNHCNEEYEALFEQMETMENGPARQQLINRMVKILEEERAWIELYHDVAYQLQHEWLSPVKPFGMSFPMHKYYVLNPELRAQKRAEWNRPVLWPLWMLAALLLVALIPGIRTFFKERV